MFVCVGFFSVKFISNFKNSEHLVLKHKHKCVLTETHLTLSLSLSLRVCLKNLDNCSRFQPSTQDCLHRLLNNEIKPSHRGVKQNIYRGGERQTGVEVVVESEKRKKHEIISSVGNKGKEGNLVGMKMKNS